MKVVGLTGGIACGKSTVTALLKQEGVAVVDCDQIAHDVVKKGRWGWKRVVAAFGPDILLPNGELDRDKLGQLVFSDPAARRKLNTATHLPVAVSLLTQLLWHWIACRWLVVVDMPLLFETGAYKLTRPRVLVYCDQGTQVRRLISRDKCAPDAALKRIQAQMPMEQKMRMADMVVDNNGALEETAMQVRDIARQLKHQAFWWGLFFSPLTVGGVLICVVTAITKK